MSEYQNFITNIITLYGQHRRNQANPDGIIYERHHIKPRCMGGGDEIYNLIDLTPREHYIAHMLLAQENPNEHKIVCAWHFMSVIKKNNYQPTPEEYEASRIAIIKNQGCPVYQLTKEGEIIGVFFSAREAARQIETTASHIIECCNKLRITAGGFYWQTIEDYIKNGFSHKQGQEGHHTKRSVHQYSLEGVYITTYDTLKAASLAVGTAHQSISKCCKGQLKTAGGYKWKFVEE